MTGLSQALRTPVKSAFVISCFGAKACDEFCHESGPCAKKGANWAAKFTPRGTTYVFVNVVVAPRYVARVQLGSGGLKIRRVA